MLVPLSLALAPTVVQTIGTLWDPRVDHTAFAPNALADVLVIGLTPTNVPTPGVGTLLVDPLGLQLLPPAEPGILFEVPVPDNCLFVRLPLFAQAGSLEPGGLPITNALDVALGTP